LLAIEGVSHATALSLMSEVGNGIHKFETAPKGSNRLKIALRNAANAIGNLKNTALSNFFNRIAYRKGRPAAISATARKLAFIIWNMIVKNVPYQPLSDYEFLDQKRKRKVQEMRKLIHKFDISINDLGLQL
jgi:transposase